MNRPDICVSRHQTTSAHKYIRNDRTGQPVRDFRFDPLVPLNGLLAGLLVLVVYFCVSCYWPIH